MVDARSVNDGGDRGGYLVANADEQGLVVSEQEELSNLSDHDLAVVTAVRLTSLREHVDARMREMERAVTLAREVYPTQKDVAQSMEHAKLEAREHARREATIEFDKAAIQYKELRDQLIEIKEQISSMVGGSRASFNVIGIVFGILGVIVAAVATLWTVFTGG